MAIRIKREYLDMLNKQTLITQRLKKEYGLITVETVRRWIRTNKPNQNQRT